MAGNASSSAASSESGPLWIELGLVVIIVAQFTSGLPVAGAIMLIGCGATCCLHSTQKNHVLILLNSLAYILIGAMAIASQLDLATRSGAPVWQVALGFDCLLAAVLGTWILRRAIQTTLSTPQDC